MSFSQFPNLLSLLRVILTVPIIITLLNADYFSTLILFIIAGVSDGLDGFIAKRFNYCSRIGSILDPAADKILLIGAFSTLTVINILPPWLFVIIFIRDIIIVAGTVGYFLGSNTKSLLRPSNISKINTTLQILLVLFLILEELYPYLKDFKQHMLIIVATATILSGIDYIWLWLKEFIINEKR